jgi:hypothetical protein
MKPFRIGICALVVFGVASHGAVEDWARAVLEIGAASLFLAWAVRAFFAREQQLIVSPLLLPLVFLFLIGAGQLVFHGTASSYSTRIELQLLLADILILFLATQAFRTLEDWRSFIWFGMSFGFLVSLFGILQHLTFNGRLYWFREMHYGGIPFGPYVNRKHLAGFAELVFRFSRRLAGGSSVSLWKSVSWPSGWFFAALQGNTCSPEARFSCWHFLWSPGWVFSSSSSGFLPFNLSR